MRAPGGSRQDTTSASGLRAVAAVPLPFDSDAGCSGLAVVSPCGSSKMMHSSCSVSTLPALQVLPQLSVVVQPPERGVGEGQVAGTRSGQILDMRDDGRAVLRIVTGVLAAGVLGEVPAAALPSSSSASSPRLGTSTIASRGTVVLTISWKR